jgi:Dual OB-containing domain
MRIVLNHITRMSKPRICIAGIDPDTGEHVRPTTPPADLITRELLAHQGGPISMGAEVELGDVHAEGTAPETEDHRFSTHALQHVRDLADDEFLDLLDRAAAQDLTTAFGPSLRRHKWKYAIDPGGGRRSLAVLRCTKTPRLELDRRYGKLQLRWSDPDPPTYLSVTDVRFYQADHKRIREDVVDDVARRLRRGVGCSLMLGVARPWQHPGDTKERHWLQLNGIVLEDHPTGDQP